MRRVILLAVTLGACNLDELFGTEPTCFPHTAYWRDADGDGVGDDATRVYFSCEQPEGWVTEPPPVHDTSDTDPHDSDPHDTDPPDTDPPDTDPPDTDARP